MRSRRRKQQRPRVRGPCHARDSMRVDSADSLESAPTYSRGPASARRAAAGLLNVYVATPPDTGGVFWNQLLLISAETGGPGCVAMSSAFPNQLLEVRVTPVPPYSIRP